MINKDNHIATNNYPNELSMIAQDNKRRKTCIITGTTNGIGYETAKLFAERGFLVYALNRNFDRAQKTIDEIRKETKGEIIDVRCDLASLESIHICANTIVQSTDKIDLLINNAGIMNGQPETTSQGIELTFAVNHLGPFFLTQLLTESLLAAKEGRIINLSSSVHHFGDLNLKELGKYKSMQSAYARSKLANILWTFKLAREHAQLAVNCVPPGIVATNLLPDTKPFFKYLGKIASVAMIPAKKSAEMIYELGTANRLSGVSGKYFSPRGKSITPSMKARNLTAQDLLWDASKKLLEINRIDDLHKEY